MRVHVVVTDEGGQSYEGEATLRVAAGRPARERRVARAVRAPRAAWSRPAEDNPDFGLSLRAFAKRYAEGLPGPAKFTVLLARLTDGKIGPTKSLKDIEKTWKRMTGLLGKYNPVHAIRARENGWVNTPKYGQHALAGEWKDALLKKKRQ
jgi:hypothetical protein